MIIQTAPAGKPHLAIMMHEHTALSGQFARAFGNDRFEAPQPDDLLFYVVSHHDEGAGDHLTSTSGGTLTAVCCRACTVGVSTMGATDFRTLY